MTAPALFIGRFQPFHLGHIDALEQIFTQESRVIIAIGSAEESYLPENPFTASERYQMIEETLNQTPLAGKIRSRDEAVIIPIRNINNYGLWVQHVVQTLPPFGKVYTGSNVVAELFEKFGTQEVIKLEMRKKISGTEVREKIRSGKEWANNLPEPVIKLLQQWKASERISNMYPTT